MPAIKAIRDARRVFSGVADAFKARGIKTARGGNWYATTVRNVKMRTAA